MWPRRIDDDVLLLHAQLAGHVGLLDDREWAEDVLQDHLKELLDIWHDDVVHRVLV